MKLESKFMIDSCIVSKVHSFSGFDAYKTDHEHDSDRQIIFIVDSKNNVVAMIAAEGECCQNFGCLREFGFIAGND